jgi:hypothetical protein
MNTITNIKKSSNGRIDIVNKDGPNMCNLFAMYDKIPANQCTTLREPTLGQWEDSDLSRAFFSEQNIAILQNGIRAGVYNKSNGQYTIAPQDCDSLKIIMRSVFLQNSVNLPDNITQQIVALNKTVLDYIIPRVYSEAQGYMQYLVDASTMAMPLANPVMASQNDKRNYKMKHWF